MSVIKKASITILGMTAIISAMEEHTISFSNIKNTESSMNITASVWPYKSYTEDKQESYKNALCLQKTQDMKFNITTGCLEGMHGAYKIEEPYTNIVGSFSPNGLGFAKAGVILEQDSFDTYKRKDLTFYIHCWQLNKLIKTPYLKNNPTSEITYCHENECEGSRQGMICAPVMCAITDDGKYFAVKHSCGTLLTFRMPSYMRN